MADLSESPCASNVLELTDVAPSADGDLIPISISSDAKSTAASKGGSSRATICGVKVENPSYIIPVLEPSANRNDGSSWTACRLWTGDDNDANLLATEQGILVEVRKRSSLIFADHSSSDTRWADEATSVKIFLPIQTAKQIGFTRLSSLGPVTQCCESSTFVLEKVSSESECEDATVLHFKDQIFSIKHTVAASVPGTSSAATTHLQLERELMALPMWTWSKLFKSSLLNLFSVRVMLAMLVTRCAVGWLDEQYSIFDRPGGDDVVKTWLVNLYSNCYHNVITYLDG